MSHDLGQKLSDYNLYDSTNQFLNACVDAERPLTTLSWPLPQLKEKMALGSVFRQTKSSSLAERSCDSEAKVVGEELRVMENEKNTWKRKAS
jgi:hypothetical protein